MRGLLISLAVLLGVVLVVYPYEATSNTGGAPGSSTGAPIAPTFNESTCASGSECHDDGEPNIGPGTIVIEAPDRYTPGETIEINIRVEEAGRDVFGFQVAVKTFLPEENRYDHIGTLELVDATTTRVLPDIPGFRNYVTHTEEGTMQNAWTMRWAAPDTLAGPITIYAAGNAADGDGERLGDHIYTASHTMTVDTGTSLEEAPAPAAFTLERAYPNPFSTSTTIGYELHHAAPVVFAVYDATGRRVRMRDFGMQAAGSHQVQLIADGLPAGLYVYELRTPEAVSSRPLLLMK